MMISQKMFTGKGIITTHKSPGGMQEPVIVKGSIEKKIYITTS